MSEENIFASLNGKKAPLIEEIVETIERKAEAHTKNTPEQLKEI